ncbi:MAG: DUF4422 domain-containing protein [Clostridia bacterium]|nr:DUF4422 domain-containing protein [Clostridia bacterium]
MRQRRFDGGMKMNLIVAVASHKPYTFPSDPVYLPVQAGAEGKESFGITADNEGDSISEKNPGFCELTVQYWLWKNREADAYGLCHYRRYFASRTLIKPKNERILNGKALETLLAKSSVILPKKRHYWVETNRSQYVHAHHEEDLILTREILDGMYGERYTAAFDRVMDRRSGHRFNMFLMTKAYFCRYNEFLFPVLFELEKRLDISGYSPKDRRVFGYVAERLTDVWLEAEKIAFSECRVVFTEKQNWPVKIWCFLKRKFCAR